MNIKGRIERIARGVAPESPPCALCALIAKAAARVYGAGFEPPAHTAEACASLRANLAKAYGGETS